MENNTPVISVVMGVYNGADLLSNTIESVREQSFSDFEFIIINDGSTEKQVFSLLDEFIRNDSRIRVITKKHFGLTNALIEGCAMANGEYIARIDAGDVMEPQRLQKQKKALDQHPACSLVTSRVGFCGPEWEPLWVTSGSPETGQSLSVISKNTESGLDADIPHHGSVMFRKSAYEQVGGYRPEFYYGQDWDLWYRLAEIGDFFSLPEMLYKARFFPDAISMSNMDKQRNIANCSLAAHVARKSGKSEQYVLETAATIRPGIIEKDNPHPGVDLAAGYYFIGEALRRAGNPACAGYLKSAIKARPTSLKSYVRFAQSWLTN